VDDFEMRRCAHLNLLEFCRESTRWGVGGALEEQGGVVLYATGAWVPVLTNGAGRVDETVPGDAVVSCADAWFGRLKRGYTVSVRDVPEDDDLRVACEAAGLRPWAAPGPEMMCRSRVEEAALPPGCDLRVVSEPDHVADFAFVNAAAYATYLMPAEAVPAIFSRPAGLLAACHVYAVVAYMEARPAAAALTIASHGLAGVYWVGAVPDARRRGLGDAVARIVTNAGFDMGARVNTLQASSMGESIYRRMGYETMYRYTTYVRLPPSRT
jgi:ribosomal protein S18 acetylase RimI-like enzyme